MASTVGNPSPPFRMMAPRGAPIKKSRTQADARNSFRCHSMAWRSESVRLDIRSSRLILRRFGSHCAACLGRHRAPCRSAGPKPCQPICMDGGCPIQIWVIGMHRFVHAALAKSLARQTAIWARSFSNESMAPQAAPSSSFHMHA